MPGKVLIIKIFLLKPKILVLSDSLPGTQGGHGVILLKQILYFGINKFCLYSGARTPSYKQPPVLQDVPTQVSPIRYFRGRRINRYITKIPLLDELFFFFILQFRKYELVNYVRKNKVNLIYAVLRGDSILLLNYLIRKTNLPLVSYIPDTIEAEEATEKRLIYQAKRKAYHKAIHQSKILAGPGLSMVNYIKNTFKKECVLFSSVLDSKLILTEKKQSFTSNQVVIGFAGSLYAKTEFSKFTLALSEFERKHNNYKLTLVIVSDKKPSHINNVTIEFFKWTTPEEVLKILSKVDIGYLPYIFDEKHKKQMMLAFPSKIVTYLALHIPVYFHGPEYSSVSSFLIKYPCGINCHSLETETIIANLEKLIFDMSFFQDCKKQSSKAFIEEFSEEKLNQNFNYFIEQGLRHNINDKV